jgi:glycosyltransferase involved in cell wall biosynthesis
MAPRISVLLLACNQQATARAAAESVLAQQCEPLEIVLSDDASSDATFEALRAAATAYTGSHQVRARRNPLNLGIGAHYNSLVADTRGALLVTAAGDDISLPHRVRRLAEAWDAGDQRADLIGSHYIDMAPDGTPGNAVVTDDLAQLTLEQWCRRRPFSLGATHAFTRRMMERFGPFVDGLWYEDPVMSLRALLAGGGITVPEALVRYRRGGTSRWPLVSTGDDLVRWVRTQNRRVLAEILQHTLDARLAGIEAPVAAALAPTLARERYLEAMLDATDPAQRWLACRSATGLPLGWRLRKFLTFTFPDQAARLKSAKARWRGRRADWPEPLTR